MRGQSPHSLISLCVIAAHHPGRMVRADSSGLISKMGAQSLTLNWKKVAALVHPVIEIP